MLIIFLLFLTFSLSPLHPQTHILQVMIKIAWLFLIISIPLEVFLLMWQLALWAIVSESLTYSWCPNLHFTHTPKIQPWTFALPHVTTSIVSCLFMMHQPPTKLSWILSPKFKPYLQCLMSSNHKKTLKNESGQPLDLASWSKH